MRTLALAALASASMLAVPAFAQSNATHSATTPPSKASSSMSNQNASSAPTMSPQQVMQLRHRIKGELQQDGFTNIYVVPDSFLVRAKNRQGEPVVMIINPHSVFSMTQISASGTTGSRGTGSSGAALGNAGTNMPKHKHNTY